eukprot:m.343619 g.343619  ORF g.343619 m.343619 type:complete len:422 (-) comp23090_c0_seq1:21-1286(-)
MILLHLLSIVLPVASSYTFTKDFRTYEETNDPVLKQYALTCVEPTKEMKDVMKRWEEAPEAILVLHDDIYDKIKAKINNETTEHNLMKVQYDDQGKFSFHLPDRFKTLDSCASFHFGTPTVVEQDGCVWHQDGAGLISTSAHSGCHYTREKFDRNEKFDKVVSITGRFSQRTYHFPADAFSALAYFPDIHKMKNVTLHINYKNQWSLDWLALHNITEDNFRIQGGNAGSKELLTPVYGHLKLPTIYQLEWLSRFRPKNVGTLDKPKFTKNRIAFIYRPVDGMRGLNNRDEVRKVLEDTGMDVVDVPSENYTTLRQQIDLYSTVDIVVGTHGAGLFFADFTPRDTCVIEFNEDSHSPEPFFILHSLAQKRLHIVIPQSVPPDNQWRAVSGNVSTADVRWALVKCIELKEERKLQRALYGGSH